MIDDGAVRVDYKDVASSAYFCRNDIFEELLLVKVYGTRQHEDNIPVAVEHRRSKNDLRQSTRAILDGL